MRKFSEFDIIKAQFAKEITGNPGFKKGAMAHDYLLKDTVVIYKGSGLNEQGLDSLLTIYK